MVNILLDDRKMTTRRNQTFAAGGKLRDSDQHAVFVKIGALFFDADFYRRFPANVVPVPIRNVIGRRAGGRSIAMNAAEILRLSRIADVFFAAGNDQTQGCEK